MDHSKYMVKYCQLMFCCPVMYLKTRMKTNKYRSVKNNTNKTKTEMMKSNYFLPVVLGILLEFRMSAPSHLSQQVKLNAYNTPLIQCILRSQLQSWYKSCPYAQKFLFVVLDF